MLSTENRTRAASNCSHPQCPAWNKACATSYKMAFVRHGSFALRGASCFTLGSLSLASFFLNQRLELHQVWTGRACSDFTYRELVKDSWGSWAGSSMCVRNEDFYFTRWMSHKDSSFSQFLSIKKYFMESETRKGK